MRRWIDGLDVVGEGREGPPVQEGGGGGTENDINGDEAGRQLTHETHGKFEELLQINSI